MGYFSNNFKRIILCVCVCVCVCACMGERFKSREGEMKGDGSGKKGGGGALTPVGPAPTITKDSASLISCFDSEGMLARSKQ